MLVSKNDDVLSGCVGSSGLQQSALNRETNESRNEVMEKTPQVMWTSPPFCFTYTDGTARPATVAMVTAHQVESIQTFSSGAVAAKIDSHAKHFQKGETSPT